MKERTLGGSILGGTVSYVVQWRKCYFRLKWSLLCGRKDNPGSRVPPSEGASEVLEPFNARRSVVLLYNVYVTHLARIECEMYPVGHAEWLPRHTQVNRVDQVVPRSCRRNHHQVRRKQSGLVEERAQRSELNWARNHKQLVMTFY